MGASSVDAMTPRGASNKQFAEYKKKYGAMGDSFKYQSIHEAHNESGEAGLNGGGGGKGTGSVNSRPVVPEVTIEASPPKSGLSVMWSMIVGNKINILFVFAPLGMAAYYRKWGS